jgi:hypothetical protein
VDDDSPRDAASAPLGSCRRQRCLRSALRAPSMRSPQRSHSLRNHRGRRSPGQGGGSGGIRTPGTSRYARFQVAGEPCAGVCRRLPTCGFSRDPSGSAWDRQQSVATRLLHADTQSNSPAGVVPKRRHSGRSRGRKETSEGTRRQTSDGTWCRAGRTGVITRAGS